MKYNINIPSELELDKQNGKDLISAWLSKLENAQIGHYSQCESLGVIHHWISIALISLTAGVTAFLFFEPSVSYDWVKILMGCCSAAAAALSGIVTFGRFGERANEHRLTAGRYGKLRRQLELMQATREDKISSVDFRRKIKTLRIEWEYIASSAPLTPKQKIKHCSIKSTKCHYNYMIFCRKNNN